MVMNVNTKLQGLMDDYRKILAEGKKEEYNEERVKIAFILPLLEALGWNSRTDEILPEQATLTGRADFGLRIGRKTRIFLEVKRFSKSLDGHYIVKGRNRSFSEQAIQYAWGMRADWAVLTNFEEIRLYDSRVKKPENGLVWKKPIKFNELISRYDELWLISKESVASGSLDAYKAKSDRPDVNDAFLSDLMRCRQLLAEDIRNNNEEYSSDEINESVQKILDRLIFIKNCEDRLIVPAESLWKRFKAWQETSIDPRIVTFMMDLKNLFIYFDHVYNGKLFERHKSEELKISNRVLEEIINTLYGDENHLGYNFSVIPFDVLGQAYELYIGSIIKEKEGQIKAIEIVNDPKIRKNHGIYYTPEFVVNFLVQKTVGLKLLNIPLEKVPSLKILDPACGSGSFLIKAYDEIRKWYEVYNDSNRTDKGPLDAHLVPISNIGKKILQDNLYGVDLDPQAVEVSILNLSLKAIETKKKLPYIGDHIKNGNSLISGEISELSEYFENPHKEKPFDWLIEFNNVFSQGGFDVVIGNPPYITMENKPEYQEYCKKYYPKLYAGKSDIHYYFIGKGIDILKNNGYLGYITSRYFMQAVYGKKIRKYIRDTSCIELIVDFGNYQVFDGVNVLTTIIVLKKEYEKDVRDSNLVKVILVKGISKSPIDLIEDIESKVDDEYDDNELQIFTIRQSELNDDGWRLIPQKTKKILDKMENISWTLNDLCEIEQSQKTGLNQAFCVNESYVKKYRLERDILKKVIKNSSILKYYINWSDEYLIYTTDKVNITDYPNISKHLEKYKEKLESRAENKKSLYSWYRLQRPRREKLFSAPEKLIVPYLATENRFALDTVGYYGTADTYIIVPKESCIVDIQYILAILNSKVLEFYHKNTAKLKREEYYEYLRKPLSGLPIFKLDVTNPLDKKVHDELVKLSSELTYLRNKYYENLHIFSKILNNIIDSNTIFSPLSEYYKWGSDYDIDLIKTTRYVDESVIGAITEILIKEEDESIVLQAKYITEDDLSYYNDVVRIYFNENTMKKFVYYSIKYHLMKNYKKRKWGKGPIWETMMKVIKIPKFITNITSDKAIIQRLMKEFMRSPLVFQENLSDLEVRYSEIEQRINIIISKLYQLSEKDIELVNLFIERQKKFVSRTI